MRRRGFSLIEVVLAMALVGLVLVGLNTFIFSMSELWGKNAFEKINPGAGLGLRIKMNKSSNTNLCIDYGFGAMGSKGFAFNLNEVF